MQSTDCRARVKRTTLAVVIAAALTVPFLQFARANEVSLSTVCGSGYGGTFLSPDWVGYTTNGNNGCARYLNGTVYYSGQPYSYGYGWTGYNQVFDLFGAGAAAASHRLCNFSFTVCSFWGYTSAS